MTGEPSTTEVAEIAGGYAAYVAEDPDAPRQLYVEVYDTNEDVTATFEVQREWTGEYINGEITEDEYAYRVIDTL